jgi:hypothetical protein
MGRGQAAGSIRGSRGRSPPPGRGSLAGRRAQEAAGCRIDPPTAAPRSGELLDRPSPPTTLTTRGSFICGSRRPSRRSRAGLSRGGSSSTSGCPARRSRHDRDRGTRRSSEARRDTCVLGATRGGPRGGVVGGQRRASTTSDVRASRGSGAERDGAGRCAPFGRAQPGGTVPAAGAGGGFADAPGARRRGPRRLDELSRVAGSRQSLRPM